VTADVGDILHLLDQGLDIRNAIIDPARRQLPPDLPHRRDT
jgi:hypothetical protein